MSNSVFVNIIMKLYAKLNNLYEKSAVHKLVLKIIELSRNSVFVRFAVKLIAKESSNHYKEESIVLKIIKSIRGFFNKFFKVIYGYFEKIISFSFIYKISEISILPLKNLGKLFNSILLIGSGFFLTRMVFLTIKYGFVLRIFIINIVLFLAMFVFSFVDYKKLENAIINSIFVRLIKWFFVE